MKYPVLGLILMLGIAPPVRAAETLTIAAASDLQFALRDIRDRYEKSGGAKLSVVNGSSGNFYSQIQNGAPFDLFFSADMDYPRRLEAAGLAEPGTFYPYGRGKIVLWVRQDSPVDVARGLPALLDPEVRKIAIANPSHAPYGRAAEAALRREGLWEKVSSRIVMGENISQTFQFIETGNADAGIIALSLALAPAATNKGKYFIISPASYDPIDQAAIVLKSSPHKAEARRFLEYLKTPEILQLMKKYGFELPPVDTAAPKSSAVTKPEGAAKK